MTPKPTAMDVRDSDIAIVGLSCRLPGAPTPQDFWRLLAAGREGTRVLADEELLARGVDRRTFSRPEYVRVCSDIDDVEWFDAAFFNCSPTEAEQMDPQHRIFLETAWAALEDAALDPSRFDGPIACYAGKTLNSYIAGAIRGDGDAAESLSSLISNDKDYLATQTSYKLDLRGPSVTVQTACSTSLVAIHMACQSLLNGECDAALAGGVSIRLPHGVGYLHLPGMVFSPDGRCRAFDASANGMLSGNGAGVVVLRRATDAIAAGDPIRAIIRGTAVNNDGARKVGFTAPSVDGQAAVIAEALAVADVDADTVSYVEAHGTGTPLGDPIEIAALTRALGRRDGEPRSIGSVKTNIGHLDAAAGVAGLIKAVLALEHGELPPSLHFAQPNPEIDFAAGSFGVQTSLAPWSAGDGPRRAGVSSFGIGGTNAHAVLQEAPGVLPAIAGVGSRLLPLSARSPEALAARSAELERHLRDTPAVSLDQVASTLQMGRRAFEYRRAIVASSIDEACAGLSLPSANVSAALPRSLVFMFPGQGAQYVGMARGLSAAFPVFRQALDNCFDLITARLGTDLRNVIFPPQDAPGDAAVLRQTQYAQPALFAVEYALAQLLISWLGRPAALIGHSVGEYAAACIAGVFSLEDAVALVVERGRLMQSMPAGAMLAVAASESELATELGPSLELAAVNGPAQCVVAGPAAAIAGLASRLSACGLMSHQLQTSHAFHSASMDTAASAFADYVARIRLRVPEVPVISNLTGQPLTGAEAQDPRYWARQLRGTVRFADGLRYILDGEPRLLLEVGPGTALHGLARRHPALSAHHAVVATMRQEQDDRGDEAKLLDAIGQAWSHGASVDWSALNTNEQRRIALPTYPFQRQRYWREPMMSGSAPVVSATERIDLDRWFHAPGWKRVVLQPATGGLDAAYVVFGDEREPALSVARELRARGATVTFVRAGHSYERTSEHAFTIAPGQRDHYDTLVQDVLGRTGGELRIVHAWNAGAETRDFDAIQDSGFYSLLWLAQALGRHAPGRDIRLIAVSSGVFDVHGTEPLIPQRATLIAPLKVVPQEYPQIRTRHIDVDPGGGRARLLVDAIVDDEPVPTLAIRGGYVWAQTFERVALPPVASGAPVKGLRARGVYMVTGGLGAVGFTLAQQLARRANARLILVTRKGTAGQADARVRELESIGAEVLVLRADVADEREMRAALATARARFGPLHGVIHAAGERHTATIDGTTRELAADQFRAKVNGTIVLDRVLAGELLDFCHIVSSMASVLGGLGLVAYTAAHCFADAWVLHRNRLHAQSWTTVNWDNWLSEDGADQFVEGLSIASGHRHGEAADVFTRLVNRGMPQILISTVDLDARIARWSESGREAAAEQASDSPLSTRYARPQLSTPYAAPKTAVAAQLAGFWQELLQIDRVGVHDNFFELGGDSVISLRFLAKAARAGVKLSTRDVFERPTIAQLCDVAVLTSAPAVALEQGVVTGESVLTPMQHWFVEQNLAQPSHFNHTMHYQTPAGLDVSALRKALQALFEHHDGLRLALVETPGGWRQRVLPAREVPLQIVTVPAASDVECDLVTAERIAGLHRQVDLESGSTVHAVYFDRGSQAGQLSIVVHHAAIDGFAWRILGEDLETAYRQAAAGEAIALPEKTTSVLAWAQGMASLAAEPPPTAQMEFWTRPEYRRAGTVPRDFPSGANTAGSLETVELSLDEETTASLLARAAKDQHTRLEVLIHAALSRSLATYTGSSTVLYDCEGLGREGLADGIDLSRTVAWCTAIHPVLIALPERADDVDALPRVVGDQIAAIPERGAWYGLLRHLGAEPVASRLRAMPSAEVVHCHLGQVDAAAASTFMPVHQQQLQSQAAGDQRRWLLEADTVVYEGRLMTLWRFSRNVHRRETIERIAREFLDTLREFASHDSARRHRPADFPQAQLEQDELDELVAEFSGLDEEES